MHHVVAEEQKIDADIMSSMLTAVNDFVADSFGTDGYLGLLQYGEHTVMIEKGTKTFVEIGPGKVLSGMIKRIDKNVNIVSINEYEDLDKLELND